MTEQATTCKGASLLNGDSAQYQLASVLSGSAETASAYRKGNTRR